MENTFTKFEENRLGIHYFPDLNHYHERDLATWLPKMKALGIHWVTLIAPFDHPIPETFITGLLSHHIQPILHFPFRPDSIIPKDDLSRWMNIYAKWGVRYAVLFDKPNSSTSWKPVSWAQESLVERFLDVFVTIAEITLKNGLIPIFPPLIPGGDYWDTIFLRTALRGIERRGFTEVLENLVIGVYAYAGHRPLNWGIGGPERFVESPPYSLLPGEEDHLGFRIFDWYQAIGKALIGKPCKMILFRVGSYLNPELRQEHTFDEDFHSRRNLAIIKALCPNYLSIDSPLLPEAPEPIELIPSEVIACNFWLLSASTNSTHVSQAWYKPDESHLPIVDYLQILNEELNNHLTPTTSFPKKTNRGTSQLSKPEISMHPLHPIETNMSDSNYPISHYLILPSFEWGVSDYHLDLVRAYIKKYRPIVGFSFETARLAKHVTIIGGEKYFPQEKINELRTAGCIVECLDENGTNIASY